MVMIMIISWQSHLPDDDHIMMIIKEMTFASVWVVYPSESATDNLHEPWGYIYIPYINTHQIFEYRVSDIGSSAKVTSYPGWYLNHLTDGAQDRLQPIMTTIWHIIGYSSWELILEVYPE